MKSVIKGITIPNFPLSFYCYFISRIHIDNNNCFLWIGYKTKNGYGKAYYQKQTYSVHRLAYHFYYGLDPDEQINHNPTCPKHCCNPLHLYAGSARQNSCDAIKSGVLLKYDQAFIDMVLGEYNNNPAEIARKYNIPKGTLRAWVLRKNRMLEELPRWIQAYDKNKYRYQFNHNGKTIIKAGFNSVDEAYQAMVAKRIELNLSIK